MAFTPEAAVIVMEQEVRPWEGQHVWPESCLCLRSGFPPTAEAPAGRWEANLLTLSSLSKAEATVGVARVGDTSEEVTVCILTPG